MPNWVYNALHCHGSKEDLDKLQEFFHMEIRVTMFDAKTKTDYYDIVPVEFTYMAMRNPFAPPYNVSEEEYHGTSGLVDGKKVGDTAGNWYNWNITHWGVKWDACREDVERQDELLSYRFESPWGPPSNIMLLEMSEKFPTIAFTHYYEEEQGWGGEYEFQNGKISEFREWDIPESHAEKMELGQTCNCEIFYDEVEYMFDDCPAKMEAMSNA